MGGTLLEMGLMNVSDERNAECHPPGGRDKKCDLHAERHIDADGSSPKHDGQREDERHARTDVAPRVTQRRNLVVAIIGCRRIDEERIVEHHRAVEHDGSHHVYDQERKSRSRKSERSERDGTGAHAPDEKLLLVAPQIGDAAENRHEQREQQRGDRFRIAPRHHHRRARLGERLEVHGDERRCKQDKS